MADDRVDELVGLLAPAAGEPLLGPASGGRPGLDVPPADLGIAELSCQGHGDRVAATTDEDDPERVMGERGGDGIRTVRRLRAHEDPSRGVVSGDAAGAMTLGEPGQPAFEPFRLDLDDAAHGRAPVGSLGPVLRG